jgi:signal transduction histidine kinase/CheY-like chemotaxis protein
VSHSSDRAAALVLSSARASEGDRQTALGIVLASVVLFAAIVPYAQAQLAAVAAFIPIYESVVVVCNLVTAVLLYGQFVLAGSAGVLALAGGYLFCASIAILHGMSFPGVFSAAGLLGGSTQTTAWLYMFWHLCFPLFVIAYALLEPVNGRAVQIEPGRRAAAFGFGAAGAVLLAGACALFATHSEGWLPAIMDGSRYSSALLPVVLLCCAASVVAPLVLWRSTRPTVLRLWLMLVMFAWLLDILVAAVLNGGRYDLGFYVGRVYGLLAACFVLGRLLLENLRLYSRLLEAYGVEQRNAAESQELARQLEATNLELTDTNRELHSASQLKSDFLSSMSHELRTPLNAIIGFAEMLKDGLVGEMSIKQQTFANHVFQSGQHLLALISDILDLSKIEAGKVELQFGEFEIERAIGESVAMIAERANAKQIRIHAERGATPIVADPRRVRQILDNLLANAVKFTPNGGEVRLVARVVDREQAAHGMPGPGAGLRLPLGDADSVYETFVEISVRDTGIGLRIDDARRLFTPFTQVDNAATRELEGTGLGLAMVRRLAELHGGAVGVSSEPGAGSCFTVWLPQRIAASDPALVPEATAPGKSRVVLMVEDDAKAATLMRLQLEAAGFEVRHVESAEQALALAGELRPDLITLDIILPGIDGWQFLDRIKEIPNWDGVPIVVVSVAANLGKGFSLGASLVLQKPVGREALLERLTRLGLPRSASGGASVLVIDDDPLAVEMLANHLNQAGHIALRALGGQEGIDLARRFLPDAIALDLEMPELDGFAVVEELKSSPATARIPIIVVSARRLSAEDRRLLNGHMLEIVAKSDFDHGSFIGEVERAMSGRISRSDLAA